MQYLSEFEILSNAIAPVPGVPFVIQGYFLLVSRLPDGIAGPLAIRLSFYPSVPFPPSGSPIPPATGSLLVDYEDGAGVQNFAVLAPDDSVTFPIDSGKTVLFGIQPNVANVAADGPLGTGAFLSRGYVMIDAASPSSIGTYQLAVVPEIRATFLSVTANPDGALNPDFSESSTVAYVLPTASGPLLTLTKTKEKFEKEKNEKVEKDGRKEGKDKDRIKDMAKEMIFDQPFPQASAGSGPSAALGLDELSQRLAAIEEMLGSGAPFIGAAERPKVG